MIIRSLCGCCFVVLSLLLAVRAVNAQSIEQSTIVNICDGSDTTDLSATARPGLALLTTSEFYVQESECLETSLVLAQVEPFADSGKTANQPDTSDRYLSPNEFLWAGERRHTLTGAPALRHTDIKWAPFLSVTGIYLATCTYLHIYQMNTIWDTLSHFRVVEDGDYGLYMDKLGHAWGGYLNAWLTTDALIASGLAPKTAALYGSALALAYQTYVEILDGFGPRWGFSPTDMYANVAGSGFFLLQNYVPFFQNFQLKANFFPGSWIGSQKRALSSSFIDDYGNYSYLLTANVHNLLPDNLKHYWLPWLNIGVGYNARDLTFRQGSRRYVIGLDINPVRLLPEGGWLWNWFRQSLTNILFPMPAVEFTEGQGARFHILYPFQINLGSFRF